ncbi:MAG: ACP S-malonyltransferase, partial [Clostridia bacterium]|nr:ACP S-malonyltransferase [Clostridia bacterium]
QYSGMGKELYETSPAAKRVFDLADTIREGTSAQCFTGTKEELTQTKNTQPCLYCVSNAAAYALEEGGVSPDMLAGFSLGEVSALAFSGAASLEDGFLLVCRRGELMQQAAEQVSSAMVAVVSLSNETVEGLCAKYSHMYPVNYNCPGQLVVAGAQEEIALFKDDIKAAGGRAIPLAVSGGFHSPFMAEAAHEFAGVLENFSVGAPKIPLYSNYTAGLYGDNPKELLAKQIKNPVRWQKIIEEMIAAGADTFIEVGPGKTLSGFIAKISGQVRTFHVEDKETLKSTIKAVKENA